MQTRQKFEILIKKRKRYIDSDSETDDDYDPKEMKEIILQGDSEGSEDLGDSEGSEDLGDIGRILEGLSEEPGFGRILEGLNEEPDIGRILEGLSEEQNIELDEDKLLNEELKKFYKNLELNRTESDKYKSWKSTYSKEQINEMKAELSRINEKKKDNEFGVLKILEKNISDEKKKELLDKYVILSYMEPFSPEYKIVSDNIQNELNGVQDKMEDRLTKLDMSKNGIDSLRDRIMKSKMDDDNLRIVYEKYQKLEGSGINSDTSKQTEWLNSILKVPFGEFKELPVSKDNSREEIKEFLRGVRKDLDENVSYLEKAKDEVMNFVGKFIQNPKSDTVNAISIYGSPGTGKTSLVREGIAKALNRPFVSIPLGGAKDSSFLLGHGYTYEGSGCGRVIDVLKHAKCMNPIIYFDELDKVSDTPHGQEIIGVLTHLIDNTQNKEFYDNYFMGVKFDLSQALFIFSYNNEGTLDNILTDRINKIRVDDPGMKEKMDIARRHLIPRSVREMGLKMEDIEISDEILKLLINRTSEKGCRELSRLITSIISRLNILNLCDNDQDIIKLNYKKVNAEFPIVLTEEMVRLILPKEEKNDSYMRMYT